MDVPEILKNQPKFLEDPVDKQDIPSKGGPVFQVDDRVRVKHSTEGRWSQAGTVVSVSGKWIHVRHDAGNEKGGAVSAVPPRFDYVAEDLEHLNPLLKFVSEF